MKVPITRFSYVIYNMTGRDQSLVITSSYYVIEATELRNWRLCTETVVARRRRTRRYTIIWRHKIVLTAGSSCVSERGWHVTKADNVFHCWHWRRTSFLPQKWRHQRSSLTMASLLFNHVRVKCPWWRGTAWSVTSESRDLNSWLYTPSTSSENRSVLLVVHQPSLSDGSQTSYIKSHSWQIIRYRRDLWFETDDVYHFRLRYTSFRFRLVTLPMPWRRPYCGGWSWWRG